MYQRSTATASTKAYYAGLSNKTAAGAKSTAAEPRRFGTNITNKYTAAAPILAKKSAERAAGRPRTAGGVTRDTSTAAAAAAKQTVFARADAAKRTLSTAGGIKVDDIDIPDAGIDSSYDKNDPTQVCAYVNDIIAHMRKEETKYMPDPNYLANMQSSSGLATRHRVSLFDWVVEVHRKFKTLRQETLWLAFGLIDRFLSKRSVAKDKLQLVGATAILIASKLEDMWPPLVRDLVYVASKAFSKDDLKKMERTMCNALRFEVVVPTLAPFLARFSKAGRLDSTGKQLANYIAELGMHDYTILKHSPSLIAASAVNLAMRMTGKGSWNSALQTTSGYTEATVNACAAQINVLVKAPPAEMKSVKNKYSRVASTRPVDF
jgi:cyclin B